MRRPLLRHYAWALSVSLAVLAFAVATTAFAQTDVTTSRISGTVKDADGGALPGVSIEAKNQDTGLVANATTNPQGFYQLVNLPTGNYTITATLSGFKTVATENLRLLLGSAPTVNFTMQLAGVAESVVVRGEVQVVEPTNTAASTTIQTEQIKNLPIAGRDFTNLVLLTPEARKEPERQNVSISGQRGINTNITVDGVEYDNAFFGGSVGSQEGRAPLSLSEESIKELTVIRNGASVEFGPSGGGYINVITKSGTNQFHGSGFYYSQPKSLTSKFASNGIPNQKRDPLDQKKNQYGASFGGPILRDRLFFFGSWDQQKQDLTVNINPQILDPAIFERYPYLDSEPAYIQTRDGRVIFGRVDFLASSSQRFMARVNYAQYEGENGTSTSQTQTVSHNGIETMQSHSWVANYSGQFGAQLLNDFNAQYTLERLPRFSKEPELPEIQVGSSTFYGSVSFLPIPQNLNDRITFGDTVSYLWKNHVSKLGAEYNKTSVIQIFKGNWRGVYIFPDTAALLAGNWSQYRQFIGLNGLSVDEAGSSAFAQKELALFLQDQWFVTPRLTVTAGVRYERLANPDKAILNPNDVNADGSFNLTGQIPDQNNKWSPRLGVSWSPDPRTVVRLSAGRFWSRTPGLLFAQVVTSNGLRSSSLSLRPTDPGIPGRGANFDGSILAPLDPSAVTRLPPPGVFTFASDFKDPRTDRISLGVDREVFKNTAASLEGTYAKATNLERLRDLNLEYDGTFSTVNGQPRFRRPNSYYTTVKQYLSDAESKYYGVTAALRHQFAQRLIAFASATWSRDRDNDSNERNFGGTQSEDGYNLNGSYGYAVRDQRWKASASATWNTPFWGIGLAGSYRYTTGQPYTATTSQDENKDGFFTDRPTIDGRHFERNSFRQPNFRSLDLRLSKAFGIGPGEFSVTADCFNCTNEANPTVASTVWGQEQTPAATFGKATNVTLFPRTIQLGARYDF